MSSERARLVYVFFSYARQDRALRDKLEDHLSNLKYRGLISTWHDREISAGTEWAHQIDIYLNKADIILLLISSSFMASEYCYSIEMKRALERHERGEARVIPILLRPVLFIDAPFAKFQFLPRNAKPVVNWRNRDSAFVDIALGIEHVVQQHFASVIEVASVIEEKKKSDEAPVFPQTIMVEPPRSLPWGAAAPIPIPLPNQSFDEGVPPVRPSIVFDRRVPTDHPLLTDGRGVIARKVPVRLVLILAIIIALLVAGILLVQHPNAIPLVGIIIVVLIFLIGLIVAIRAVIKQRQEQRAKREREQRAREEEVARRREREERQRRLEEERQRLEALERQREEDRRQLEEWRAERQQREQEREYYEKALAAYDKALRLDFTDATAYRGRGKVVYALGRYDEALEAFEKAVYLDPRPAAYVGKGRVLLKLKRYDDSIAAYERSIELDPAFASAYAEMSETLEQLGRSEEAQQAREKAKQLGYEE